MKNIAFIIVLVVLSSAGYGQKVNFFGDMFEKFVFDKQ